MLHGFRAATVCLLLLLSGGAAADPTEPDPGLSARAIYERVLANRFHASVQELALVSADRGGREQPLRVQMLWRRYDGDSPGAEDGTLSRTLIRYLEPVDLRGTGYLIINKADTPDDQFMYLRSLRRSRRINLRSQTVIGTDLSIEDIVPRELDDAHYERAADAYEADTPCYVIDAIPVENANSQYSRFRLYVEPEHFVPLRTRYWNRADVEVKELVAPPEKITEIDGVWIPLEARMQHLLDGSYTHLRVLQLTPNPTLPKSLFTQRQLEQRKLRLPESVTQGARAFQDG